MLQHKLFTLIFVCVFALQIHSTYAAWLWSDQIAGTLNDKPDAIAADHSDNVYIIGQVKGDSIDLEGMQYSTNGYDALYIAKYSRWGQVLWTKIAYGPGDVKGSSMAIDTSGNIYITGSFTASKLFVGNTVLQNQGTENIFVIKYNANGELQWGKVFGGNATDMANSITISNENLLYLGGKFSSGSIDFDAYTLTNKGNYDGFLIQCNDNGDVNWAKSFGSTDAEEIVEVASNFTSDVFAIGNFYSDTLKVEIKNLINKGSSDIFICKYNASGSYKLAVSFGESGIDEGHSIQIDGSSSNLMLIAGEFESPQLNFGSFTLNNQGGKDGFIVKLNPGGIPIYTKTIATSQDEYINSLQLTDGNSINVGGSFSTDSLVVDTITLYSNGQKEGFFFRFDSTLNVTRGKSIGGSGDDEVNKVVSVYLDVYTLLAGNFQSSNLTLDNDTFTNMGGSDMFLTLYGDSADISQEASITEKTTTAYGGGLFGGSMVDLTYSPYNNRLFAGLLTPASLFYTDDTAQTWAPCFPNDSLEYDQQTRGWGGYCTKIFANETGWLIALTNSPYESYSAAVVNYNGGDTGKWTTFVDQMDLVYMGYSSKKITAVNINDYYIYAAAGTYLMRGDSLGLNTSSIIDVSSYITLPSNATINCIAVPNSSTGYPLYFTIDEFGDAMGTNRRLFKYDGNAITELSLTNLSTINGIREVFTHKGQTTGDTLFITAKDINTQEYKIYRSYNAGFLWADVSCPLAYSFMREADYSPKWPSQLTSSNGLILIIPGYALSKDLGNNWEYFSDPFGANAVHPENTSLIAGGRSKVYYSTSGASGTYSTPDNSNLRALTINEIARTTDKKIFYVATFAGLGYTKAYLDTTIAEGDKWDSPNGAYPLISDAITFGAVAIDANDTAHVIAGCPEGFYVTTTGVSGFGSAIVPTGFGTNDPQVNDIAIINSSVVLAVTGGKDSASYSGMGHIWRSIDGGLNWTDVSPTGYMSGNVICVGYGATDTIIYVGTGLDDVDTGKIWKSLNMGLSWTEVNIGPTSMSGNGATGLAINDMELLPGSADSLYIASGNEDSYAFVLSPDGGQTYEYISLQGSSGFTSVAINQEYPDSVYIALDKDIYVYSVSGNSFTLIYEGLPGERVPELAYGSILVGTTTGFYTFHPTWEDIVDAIEDKSFNVSNDNILAIYPNPVSNEASLKIELTEQTSISLAIYDVMGQKVFEKDYGSFNKGTNEISIETSALTEGNYFMNLQLNSISVHKKILVIR